MMLTRRRLLTASTAAATAYAAYASCEEKGPDRYGLTHPYRPELEPEGTPRPTESASPRSPSTRRPRVLVTGFHDWRELESNLWRCVRVCVCVFAFVRGRALRVPRRDTRRAHRAHRAHAPRTQVGTDGS